MTFTGTYSIILNVLVRATSYKVQCASGSAVEHLLAKEGVPRTDAFIRLFSEELQNGVTILKDSVGYYYVLVETVQTAAFTVAMVNTVRALRNALSHRAKRGTQKNSINRKI